jgi:diguanylate cyclase (GGDEF)-like protein/PAS domain S-box-containing protein
MKTVREDNGLPEKKPLSLLSMTDRIPLINSRQRKAALAEVGTAAELEKVLTWTRNLIQGIHQAGYPELLTAKDLKELDAIEQQAPRQQGTIDDPAPDQVSDLIRVNKRLQLEMLERDLVEEQVFRKSKLLEAINQVLNQMVANRSEHSLAATCLRAGCELTGSPFGFIVENQEGCWRVLAMASDAGRLEPSSAEALSGFPMNNFWRELMQISQAQAFPAPGAHPLWRPLPEEYPEIRTLLVVPLPVKAGVPGFIALANNPQGYAFIDQSDVQTLALSFVEALQRLRAEQAKQISERRLHLALDSAEEGLWDYLVQSREIYYSPRCFTLLGYRPGELPCSFETWVTLTHPDDVSMLKNTIRTATRSGEEAFKIEIRMLAQEGQWRWIQVRGRAVERDAQGVAVRLVGTLIDISRYKHVETALQKANEELQRLAALDDLTQIANRRRFDERLNDEWRRARRDGAPLGLIIADIDYFKAYNDTYGHVRGDEILYAVAQAISATLKRPMDMVARYGGEEFVILLPNTDLCGAAQVAHEIKTAVQDLKIKHRASKAGEYVTLSFGVASLLPEGAAPARSIVESADRALYRAKALGRDHVVAAGMDEGACLQGKL